MKEVTKYICEHCRREYGNKDLAEQCEKNHVVRIRITHLAHKDIGVGEEPVWPNEITIESEAGETRTYHRY